MRISCLRLKNWACYRGEQVLDLESKIYAIVARKKDDADRSNFLGKSSILEAIEFALYGRHRHRTEDEWITRGEAIGEVELTLDTGERILRTRQRGKRTTLYLFEGSSQSMQDEAQLKVDEIVGVSADDFRNTSYFQQRQMARLVLADPGSRMDIISAWLRLGPLQECEDKAREQASKLLVGIEQRESLKVRTFLLQQEAELNLVDPKSFDDLTESLKKEVTKLTDALQENAELVRAREFVAEFDELVVEGTALREEVDSVDADKLRLQLEVAEGELKKAWSVNVDADKEMMTKRTLAKGQFDGKCPVANIECPARAEINSGRERNTKLYEKAADAAMVADREHKESLSNRNLCSGMLRDAETLEGRLKELRRRVAEMEDSYEEATQKKAPEDIRELRDKLEAARLKLNEVSVLKERAANATTTFETAQATILKMDDELKTTKEQLALLREAAVIFGKNGAQRRVAEGALAEIEEGANEMLRSCGIDLKVAVQWSREGSGLAKTCEACGSPFPSSTKVKVCSRCGAGRGPLMVNKLDVVLSDRSGAAEDLGGAAIQLAASAWLRRERECNWSTALLDEPFGQLDKTHRRAFGIHLAAMLRGAYGFEQGFVVAHTPDVLDALPGRIEIVSEDGDSTVRVVA